MGYIYGLFVVVVLYDLLINWPQDRTQNKSHLLGIEKKNTETVESERPLYCQNDTAMVKKNFCINISEKLPCGHNWIDNEIHGLKYYNIYKVSNSP